MENTRNNENGNKIMKIGATAHNKRLTLRRLFGGSGLRMARSVATLAPTPCSTHIWGRGQRYALPYYLPKTSYT